MEAYTYLLIHKKSGKLYYGVRKSKRFDLFETYFTSSKLVKRLIAEEGITGFAFELRRSFDSYEAARKWETKFLQKVNAVTNPKMLNQAISAPRICNKDSVIESQRRTNISEGMKCRWTDTLYREKQKKTHSTEFYKRIGTMSSKNKVPKPKRPSRPTSLYKLIDIERNGVNKRIHENQFSAYKRLGWTKSLS